MVFKLSKRNHRANVILDTDDILILYEIKMNQSNSPHTYSSSFHIIDKSLNNPFMLSYSYLLKHLRLSIRALGLHLERLSSHGLVYIQRGEASHYKKKFIGITNKGDELLSSLDKSENVLYLRQALDVYHLNLKLKQEL